MFKKYLEKLIARKKTELKATELRFDNAKSEAEVRELGEALQTLKDEIADAEEQLKALDEDNADDNANDGDGANDDNGADARANAPVVVRGGNPMATYNTVNADVRANVSTLDSIQYRNAFANYVRTGQLDAEYRDNADVFTQDVGMLIPNTIMSELIKELKVYGNLYNKVRKLNVRGGVQFPIEELVPQISWITEATVSDTQKAPQVKTSISFGYHVCEARISQSLLAQVVTLDVLEQEIARLLAEAFVKEFDKMIVKGSGEGQPLGIVNDTRIDAKHKVAFTDADLSDWTKWRKKLFAIIPLAYRGQGVLVMTANTWETYCMTLTDNNKNPIGTETFDVQNGTTICKFAGREVILVEPDVLADFDTATSGEAFAIYFKPNDYAINSNMQVGFKRYFNEETNKYVNKGLAIVDGKMLDVNGAYILTK